MISWLSSYLLLFLIKRPRVISETEKASSLDLLPLHTSSQRFSAVNVLAAKVFWTGHLEYLGGNPRNLRVYGSLERLQPLQHYVEQNLDLKININPQKNGEDSFILSGGENGAFYARLLGAMGLSSSYEIPNYVRKLVEAQSTEDSTFQKALQDFVQVLFEERFHMAPEKKTYRLYLKRFDKEEDTRGYGSEVIEVIKVALPELHLTQDHLKVQKTREPGKLLPYCPTIYLRGADMDSLSTHYPALLKESSLS